MCVCVSHHLTRNESSGNGENPANYLSFSLPSHQHHTGVLRFWDDRLQHGLRDTYEGEQNNDYKSSIKLLINEQKKRTVYIRGQDHAEIILLNRLYYPTLLPQINEN